MPNTRLIAAIAIAMGIACSGRGDVASDHASSVVSDSVVVGPAKPVLKPLKAEFTDEWTSITRRSDGRSISLRAHGRSGHPEVRDERTVFQVNDSALSEWYAPHINGIEQGFTVSARPTAPSALDDLIVDVDLDDGVEAHSSSRPNTVDLTRRGDERPSFRYGALAAYDAHGKELNASLSTRDGGVRIRVDDHDAVYPIMIDPLIWALQSKLTAIDGKDEDNFGASVAIDGDTLIVGALSHDDLVGATYIYRRRERCGRKKRGSLRR